MDCEIKSPPKPVRVVHMSPAGVICSPFNAHLQRNPSECIGAIGGSSTTFHGLPLPVITTPIIRGEMPPPTLELDVAKTTLTPIQIHRPKAGERMVKQEAISESNNQENEIGFCAKEITDAMASSSMELEGMLVDKAVRTLPQVVNEVAVMHRGQLTEIQRNELNLRDLKVKKTLAKEKNEELIQEISSVTHKIYLTEEDRKESNKKCKRYKTDLDDIVSECERIKRDIAEKQELINEETSLYELYKSKMEKFVDLVRKHESQSAIHLEIQDLQNRVQSLSEKKKISTYQGDSVFKDEQIKNINKKIEDTKMNISVKESELLAINTKIKEEKDKQVQEQQSIHVLHKKNAAQMTRLKNQVREVHMRSRRWKDQINQLEKTIKELTQRLEE